MNVSITLPSFHAALTVQDAVCREIKRLWQYRHSVYYRTEIRNLIVAMRALRKA